MRHIRVVKILQPLNGIRELKGTQGGQRNTCAVMAYELQMVSSVITDVLRDVSVGHPFGDHSESPILEGVRNANKVEDVWMGQVLPNGNSLTEVLYGV